MKKIAFLAILFTLAGCGADAPRPTNQEIIAYARDNCPWIQTCFTGPCPTIAICPDLGPVFIGMQPNLGR